MSRVVGLEGAIVVILSSYEVRNYNKVPVHDEAKLVTSAYCNLMCVVECCWVIFLHVDARFEVIIPWVVHKLNWQGDAY